MTRPAARFRRPGPRRPARSPGLPGRPASPRCRPRSPGRGAPRRAGPDAARLEAAAYPARARSHAHCTAPRRPGSGLPGAAVTSRIEDVADVRWAGRFVMGSSVVAAVGLMAPVAGLLTKKWSVRLGGTTAHGPAAVSYPVDRRRPGLSHGGELAELRHRTVCAEREYRVGRLVRWPGRAVLFLGADLRRLAPLCP